MVTFTPLDQFHITSTRDIDEAQAILSNRLSDLRIKHVGNHKKFSLEMNGTSFGRTQLYANEFAECASVDPGYIEESIILILGYKNSSVIHIDGKPVVCNDHSAAIVSPSKNILIERPADSGFILVRSTQREIRQRYQEITGREPLSEIIFDNSVDLAHNNYIPLHKTIEFLISTLHDIPDIINNPSFKKSFDDLILSGLLSLPNNHYDKLNKPADTGTPDIIRHAEEFMEANALEPITISDIVNACNCSRSSLFEAFQRYKGYSPIQFLTDRRLDRAYAQLLHPAPNDTVTSVAYQCGLFHLGRFSAAYKKRFGQSPSKTLKCNR